jgi:methionyl-tRNA formyltransferase
MVSVVILTGDQRRHRFCASALAERVEVRGVVCEPATPPGRGQADSPDAAVIAQHLTDRDEVERRFFAAHNDWPADMPRLTIAKGDVNLPQTVAWIAERRPDCLVVYGSSLIGEPLLLPFAGRCLNLHLGLSPYYRGSATNFWPLVNREPELVGATVHLVTSRIDGGPIVCQARPAMQADDRAHQIGCRAIVAGTGAMIRALSDPVSWGRAVPQSRDGRLYRRADFTADAVRRMWRQFDTAMIPEYLADPARVDRFPLVSAPLPC